MLMDFEEHRHHRRIMQQAFKRERLIGYVDALNPRIEGGSARGGGRTTSVSTRWSSN
jgi:cytochrome P450